MADTLELKVSPFDLLYYRLFIFSNEQATHKVLDALGNYTDRTPNPRLSQLLDCLGMKTSIPYDKLQRPVDTFVEFDKAFSSFRKAGTSLGSLQDFSKQLADALQMLDQENNSANFLKSSKLVGIHAITTPLWQATQAGLHSLNIVLDNLSRGADFCALDWMLQLQKAKDKRWAFSNEVMSTFGKALDDELNNDSNAESVAFLRYRTDPSWHSQRGDDVHLDNYHAHDRCNCAKLSSAAKWAYAAWVGDNNPNIDGRNRDQTFCVFQTRFDHYRQCSYQEVLGWLTIGFEGAYGSQPRNPAIETRALWNSEKNQAEFDYGTAPKEESAYHHNWRKSIRIAQLTQALCWEWGTKPMIEEQWRYLSRAVPYLEEVRRMQNACLEAVKQLQKDLSRFTHLAQGLDYWIQEIPTLKLVAGSEYFIKCLQVDMVANVTEMNAIWNKWTADQTRWDTIKLNKPSLNRFEFFDEYIVKTQVDETIPRGERWGQDGIPWPDLKFRPYLTKWPAKQTTGWYAHRAIPFPYPRPVPSVSITGFCHLDFASVRDIFFSLSWRAFTTSGFNADIACLDRNSTEAYGVGICYMDIPMRDCGSSNLAYDKTADDFRRGVKQDIVYPDWMKQSSSGTTSSKLRDNVKVAHWINGLRLGTGKDWNVSVSAKGNESITVKAEGSTNLSYFNVCYFYWDDVKTNVFCKTFKTAKNASVHEEVIDFGTKFSSKPKFFLALTDFNIWSERNMRIQTEVKELTQSHAVVKVHTWEESKIFELGFVCIAVPDRVGLY